jgi:hypothetical protein
MSPSVQGNWLVAGIYLFLSGSLGGLSAAVGAVKRAWAGAATGAALGFVLCGVHAWWALPESSSRQFILQVAVLNIMNMAYLVLLPAFVGSAAGFLAAHGQDRLW